MTAFPTYLVLLTLVSVVLHRRFEGSAAAWVNRKFGGQGNASTEADRPAKPLGRQARPCAGNGVNGKFAILSQNRSRCRSLMNRRQKRREDSLTMAKIAPIAPRTGLLRGDQVPNATGLVLCMAIAVPIWAGILALIF